MQAQQVWAVNRVKKQKEEAVRKVSTRAVGEQTRCTDLVSSNGQQAEYTSEIGARIWKMALVFSPSREATNTLENLRTIEDKAMVTTNGLTIVSLRVGGTITNNTALEYTLVRNQPRQDLESGRWANGSSGWTNRNAARLGTVTSIIQTTSAWHIYKQMTKIKVYPGSNCFQNTKELTYKDNRLWRTTNPKACNSKRRSSSTAQLRSRRNWKYSGRSWLRKWKLPHLL